MKKIIDIASLTKTYGEKTLFSIKHLEVFEGDRIGILGSNGSGKSTLMKIIAGQIKPDTGTVSKIDSMAYMAQPTGSYIESTHEPGASASLFNVMHNEGYSGGERTKRALTNALSQNTACLLLDEPTTNMDLDSMQHLESELMNYTGTLLVISHDKAFLNAVVQELWILDEGEIRTFTGTPEQWEQQKAREVDHQLFEYNQDQKERKRLEAEAARIRVEAQKVGKKPKHMSSKEARIYAGTASVQQGHVQRRARQLLSRKEHKQTVERPNVKKDIKIKLGAQEKLRAKVAISVDDLNISYGEHTVFHHADATFETNKCTVISGPNGSGKTTLIHAIVDGHSGINVNPGIRFGIFSQFHESIDESKSLLQNVMRESVIDQGKVRTILSNLRFSVEDLDKQASKLSGGERAKCVCVQCLLCRI